MSPHEHPPPGLAHARPNIVFILADDLGYADLGCTGARTAEGDMADTSPCLDEMARQGMRFTRSYANSPVCSPKRFALATGRWQYRLRGGAEEPLHGDKVFGLPPGHPTLASLLRDAGYRTALVGKWHLGHPPEFGPRASGYESFFGFHAGAIDYFSHRDGKGRPDLWRNESSCNVPGYLTDVLSGEAVDFISRQSPETPFLLSLHYSAPHWPWQTRGDAAESERIRSALKHLDGGSLATYQRMVHHMDEGIGTVLDALAEHGFAENTLVVFTSDNGGERYSNNWPFVGQKMDLLEGGIRVPLIARWPRRIAGGQLCHVPHMTMDWTATMLAAAGAAADPGHPLDGVDLCALLANPEQACERSLFWRMKHRQQAAVVRGRWKWLRIEGDEYLFDLVADPRERANLRDREPSMTKDLRAAWHEWNTGVPPIPADAGVSLVFGPSDLPCATF